MTKRERVSKKLREQIQRYENLVDLAVRDTRTGHFTIAASFWVAARKMHRIFLRETRG